MLKTCLVFVCSGLVVLIAILLGFLIQMTAIPSDISIHLDSLEKQTIFAPTKVLLDNPDLLSRYQRDGVLFVPELLSQEEAAALRETSNDSASRIKNLFDFFPKTYYNKISFDLWRTNEIVASLSLVALPKAVADIMNTYKSDNDENKDGNFRLLRDAFFNYASGGKGCGWHVDDEGFWPAKNDTSGLTVWIALDEIKVSEGGGLAIANMTLAKELATASGKDDLSVDFCVQEIRAKGTCEMEINSPDCNALLESARLEWDMKPGDAILWDRWTFHKGVPSVSEEHVEKKRYSVRYMPNNAKAFGAIHSSVEQGSSFDSPYYPQVWPNLIEEEQKALEKGLDGDLSVQGILHLISRLLKRKLEESLGFSS